MAQVGDTFDLGRLGLRAGEGRSIVLDVRVDPFGAGGTEYRQHRDRLTARLDCSRTTSGWSLRLRFAARVVGPCMRCLEEADATVDVDTREVEQPGADEELHTPYIERDVLDLRSWTRDALLLSLPVRLVCDSGCRGLCPVCGANLNREAPEAHRHGAGGDTRWAKLGEIRFD